MCMCVYVFISVAFVYDELNGIIVSKLRSHLFFEADTFISE